MKNTPNTKIAKWLARHSTHQSMRSGENMLASNGLSHLVPLLCRCSPCSFHYFLAFICKLQVERHIRIPCAVCLVWNLYFVKV